MTGAEPAACRVYTLRTPLTDAARYEAAAASAAALPAREDTCPCGICGVPHPDRPCRVLERHLDHMRMQGRSELTIRDRRNLLNRAGRRLPVAVLDASHDDLMGWRQGLTRRRLGDGAVAGAVSGLRVFYQWVIDEEGILADNPARRIPVPGRARMLPRPIAEPDLATALDDAPPRIRIWLVLAAWCGLRAKEIALLRRESILDAADSPVLIVAIKTTKGGHRERVVPLPEFVLAELRRARLPRSGYVFLRRDGQPGPNRPGMVSQLANDHLHECGITASLHQLRHRYGSQAYQVSHDLRLVQELMGHASPEMTAGYSAYDNAAAAATAGALRVPGETWPRPVPAPARPRSRTLPAPRPKPEPQRTATAYQDIAAELAARPLPAGPRLAPRPCPNPKCGRTFTPARSNAVYCTVACCQSAAYQRRLARRPSPNGGTR